MARVKAPPSALACMGMLAGMLLLGFAGTLVVMTPSSFVAEVQKEGMRFLQQEPRRLQVPVAPSVVDPITGLVVPAVTTTLQSSLDSSDSSSSGSVLEPFKSVESNSFKKLPQGVERLGGAGTASGSTIGTQLLFMLCFACCYYSNAIKPVLAQRGTLADRPNAFQPNGKDDFDTGICGCFDDMWVCIHGFCCPLVRMAHTNAVGGVLGFWESACVWCCCSIFTSGLGTCCLMVYWRKQLKEIMGIEDHLVNDMCITCFCPFLSICQQGTAVDQAMGYEVTGCCTLEQSDY